MHERAGLGSQGAAKEHGWVHVQVSQAREELCLRALGRLAQGQAEVHVQACQSLI